MLVVFLILGCGAPPEQEAESPTLPTAEEIVAACAEAYGGVERLEAMRTFRIITSWDGAEPGVVDIRRPNLMRTEGRSILVFDGERAATLGPNGPELLDEGVWKDFEIDLAFRFPAFFDYPAALVGTDTVAGVETHELRVTLPLGTEVSYFIDGNTFLPVRAITEVTIDGVDYTPEIVFGEFVEVEGVLFPSTYRQGWLPETAQDAVLQSAAVNVVLPDDHFTIAPGSR
jgi:outer membrane lipoprotein-sorting protein